MSVQALPDVGILRNLYCPRIVPEWLSTSDRDHWPQPPAGDGRPAMLVPGLAFGDQTLTRMAVWLRGGGFELVRSGIGHNTACMEPVVVELEGRLEQAVQRTGKRALLVGQSRGGQIARALAALRPDLVSTLVTLGSPLTRQLSVRPVTWPTIVAVGALGTCGVRGMFSITCIAGSCCARSRAAAFGRFPEDADVEFLSVYSRSDEIVNWESCLDPAATQLEVDVSHLGMGFSREVWEAVADQLGQSPPAM